MTESPAPRWNPPLVEQEADESSQRYPSQERPPPQFYRP